MTLPNKPLALLPFLLSLLLFIGLGVMMIRSDRAAIERHDELKRGLIALHANQASISQTCRPGEWL